MYFSFSVTGKSDFIMYYWINENSKYKEKKMKKLKKISLITILTIAFSGISALQAQSTYDTVANGYLADLDITISGSACSGTLTIHITPAGQPMNQVA